VVSQRPGVNHVNHIFRVIYVGYLQPSIPVATPNHKSFSVLTGVGVGVAGMFDDPLRLFGGHAVFGDVLDVPFVPSENHGEAPYGILLYRKIIQQSTGLPHHPCLWLRPFRNAYQAPASSVYPLVFTRCKLKGCVNF